MVEHGDESRMPLDKSLEIIPAKSPSRAGVKQKSLDLCVRLG
jgi:hypothetical protein